MMEILGLDIRIWIIGVITLCLFLILLIKWLNKTVEDVDEANLNHDLTHNEGKFTRFDDLGRPQEELDNEEGLAHRCPH